jgi:hypothetical protein
MKIIHLTVRLEIQDDADAYDVAESLDYKFEHPSILDTEITNVCDENNVDVF